MYEVLAKKKKGLPKQPLMDVGFQPGTPEQKIFKDWLTYRYHAPSDDINQPVDLQAAALYLKRLCGDC